VNRQHLGKKNSNLSTLFCSYRILILLNRSVIVIDTRSPASLLAATNAFEIGFVAQPTVITAPPRVELSQGTYIPTRADKWQKRNRRISQVSPLTTGHIPARLRSNAAIFCGGCIRRATAPGAAGALSHRPAVLHRLLGALHVDAAHSGETAFRSLRLACCCRDDNIYGSSSVRPSAMTATRHACPPRGAGAKYPRPCS
jgi:hypothetical protein